MANKKMEDLPKIVTDRLFIEPLSPDDHAFIFELLNTENWNRFIGNRNIHSKADAVAYIEKIVGSPDVTYWVVRLKTDGVSIGIITLLKRSYLTCPDIGFAFLPRFFNRGYAFEAAEAVLNEVIKVNEVAEVFAITTLENHPSVRLLNRLGMKFQDEITIDEKRLQLYSLDCRARFAWA
jgi:RimJ/RimL family protein N-acetyltransferase